MNIRLAKAEPVGNEIEYVNRVLNTPNLAGDGDFTKKATMLLEKKLLAAKVLLTTSCTHALELASLLIDLKPGDEVVMPSYTFSSTANAVMLRGAKPVFVDIRKDTLNLDETLLETKITKKTKAIYPVHYAGVGCEMEQINAVAAKYQLKVVEDAAQGIWASYKGKALGTWGDLGALSFHESKNIVCGEGGALIINDSQYCERAEIIREKGTDRSKFFRGEVDKYTWVDIGSSYLPSEILAAFLLGQLEKMDIVMKKRKIIYDRYMQQLKPLAEDGLMVLPTIPNDCTSNNHIFYLLLKSENIRNELMAYLKQQGIYAVFHYLPLHLSPMGLKMGYQPGDLPQTEDLSGRLLRLPLYYSMTKRDQDLIINQIKKYFGYA